MSKLDLPAALSQKWWIGKQTFEEKLPKAYSLLVYTSLHA